MEIFLLPLFAVAFLTLPFVYIIRKHKSPKQARRAFIVNMCSFFAVLALSIILPIGGFIGAEAGETVSMLLIIQRDWAILQLQLQQA